MILSKLPKAMEPTQTGSPVSGGAEGQGTQREEGHRGKGGEEKGWHRSCRALNDHVSRQWGNARKVFETEVM